MFAGEEIAAAICRRPSTVLPRSMNLMRSLDFPSASKYETTLSQSSSSLSTPILWPKWLSGVGTAAIASGPTRDANIKDPNSDAATNDPNRNLSSLFVMRGLDSDYFDFRLFRLM